MKKLKRLWLQYKMNKVKKKYIKFYRDQIIKQNTTPPTQYPLTPDEMLYFSEERVFHTKLIDKQRAINKYYARQEAINQTNEHNQAEESTKKNIEN